MDQKQKTAIANSHSTPYPPHIIANIDTPHLGVFTKKGDTIIVAGWALVEKNLMGDMGSGLAITHP